MTTAILFDLDGTLVDSATGILRSLEAAFDEHGLAWPAFGSEIVGPPLYRFLPGVIGHEATDRIMASYRRNYAEWGLFESPPFEGVTELLHDLRAAGCVAAVATSKAEVFATRIIADKGWTDLFVTVGGDTLSAERPTKADVIREVMGRIGHHGGVMIGDRETDVRGAHENGLLALGAAWGYGAPSELVGAVEVLSSPADVLPCVDRLLFA